MTYPKNNKALNKLQSLLDELLDTVGDDERHKVMGLIDVISTLITSYEATTLPLIKPTGVYALKYLMEAHQLKQSDLTEIGSQSIVSKTLNGKRQLNLRQVQALAKRFHVEPSTFIDTL